MKRTKKTGSDKLTDTELKQVRPVLVDSIMDFFKMYKENGDSKYHDRILSLATKERRRIEVDFVDFSEYEYLLEKYKEDATRFLESMSKAAFLILSETFGTNIKGTKRKIEISLVNTPNQVSIRGIKSATVGEFISVSGMLIRISAVESLPLLLYHACPTGHITQVKANNTYIIQDVKKCSFKGCGSTSLEIIDGIYEDYQIISVQETTEDLQAGSLPKAISILVVGDLVDTARLGEMVQVGGIIRAELSKKLKLGKEIQTFKNRLHANSIVNIVKSKKKIDNMDDILKLAKLPEDELTQTIVNSFAPHIYGNDIIKESILLSMISAETVILTDGSRVRGDINIFLLGDPGTAKSEMGKAAYRIAPRAFYTSGKGASGVGLTAATIKDNDTGAYLLEPGIVVLADKGLAVIDEFDKMRPEDRSALHEAMEQQIVSVAKGGINATLNARTAIIAIANPEYGRYDPYKSMVENVQSIPIPLLTRFDLIFIIRDIPEKSKDKAITKHIIHTYSHGEVKHTEEKIDTELLASYIRHAKTLKPKMTKEAEDLIEDYYMKLRFNADVEVITPRQLQGILRLTTARARLMLKDHADRHDAERAIHIMQEMLKNSATDPDTGKIDMMEINSGKTKKTVMRQQLFTHLMKQIPADSLGIPVKVLVKEMVATEKWDNNDARPYINKMLMSSIIYEPTVDKYRLMSGASNDT